MKKYIILILFSLTAAYSQAQKKLTVYVFMAEECPVCNYVAKSLQSTSIKYKDEVNFVAVFPQRLSNIKTASLFKKKYNLDLFTIEIDKEQKITSKLNASVTPEVIIVDDLNNILYQGRINDSYAAPGRIRHGRVKEDLKEALQLILQEKEVLKPWPEPVGCFITKRNG